MNPSDLYAQLRAQGFTQTSADKHNFDASPLLQGLYHGTSPVPGKDYVRHVIETADGERAFVNDGADIRQKLLPAYIGRQVAIIRTGGVRNAYGTTTWQYDVLVQDVTA
jgi:hypothetical protein